LLARIFIGCGNYRDEMVTRAYEEPAFCEVLERVPKEIRQSLTFEQRSAIAQAVKESQRRHFVDVRIPIPLFFIQLYFVCFLGKDSRRETRVKLGSRRLGLAQWGTAGLMGVFGLALTCAGITAAYVVKSKSGVDLLSDLHAKDVLQGLGAW
jgi:hypothetical protein